MRFIPQGITVARSDHFVRVRLEEYDQRQLPVQVHEWMPYRAQVRADEACWFETPREFKIGYVASVKGVPTGLGRSPEGLVMISVPKGKSTVELRCVAPLGLQLLFWLSALAIFAAFVVGLALATRTSNKAVTLVSLVVAEDPTGGPSIDGRGCLRRQLLLNYSARRRTAGRDRWCPSVACLEATRVEFLSVLAPLSVFVSSGQHFPGMESWVPIQCNAVSLFSSGPLDLAKAISVGIQR